ncbi:MAG: precorrin-8X methylmutase [Bdellovibrionia bacterium]
MSDMRQMTSLGRNIEDNSFAIIDQEVGKHQYSPDDWEVVRRVIHATADFEFKELMSFHSEALLSGIRALKAGCPIICDVQMIIAGLNKERLEAYGCKSYSFISDEDVIRVAKENNSTRAIESMRKAHKLGLLEGAIVAIGNAPTALLEIVRLILEENVRPSLIVGVPVGFVSAAESKEAIRLLGNSKPHSVPYIVSRGRKGGSTIAVSILHALLLLSTKSSSA